MVQLGGNDGSGVLKSSMALRLVYGSGTRLIFVLIVCFVILEDGYFHFFCSLTKDGTFFDVPQNDLIHAWGLDKQLGYCAQASVTFYVNGCFALYAKRSLNFVL